MSNVKVHFQLEIEEDGFPPISVETLNGILKTDGFVTLDNTPFFALNVALGDMVLCEQLRNTDGLWFKAVVEQSNNLALSVIYLDDVEDLVYDFLTSLGCYCEYGEFGQMAMLAVCVFPNIEYNRVKSFLDKHESAGALSYAELCI